jgi:hypothetical protein
MAAPIARGQMLRAAFPGARGPRMVLSRQSSSAACRRREASCGEAGRLLVLAVLAAQGMRPMLPCRGCAAAPGGRSLLLPASVLTRSARIMTGSWPRRGAGLSGAKLLGGKPNRRVRGL